MCCCFNSAKHTGSSGEKEESIRDERQIHMKPGDVSSAPSEAACLHFYQPALKKKEKKNRKKEKLNLSFGDEIFHPMS